MRRRFAQATTHGEAPPRRPTRRLSLRPRSNGPRGCVCALIESIHHGGADVTAKAAAKAASKAAAVRTETCENERAGVATSPRWLSGSRRSPSSGGRGGRGRDYSHQHAAEPARPYGPANGTPRRDAPRRAPPL